MENKNIISNPYKALGIMHNAGLDYIITRLDPQNYDVENVIDLDSQYMQTIENNQSQLYYVNFYEFIGTTLNTLEQIPFDEFLRENKISKQASHFIKEILNVSEDLELDFTGTLTVLSNIEENILFSEMSPTEKKLPLLCVAIAKASVTYWIAQLGNASSPWIPFIPGPIDKFKWPWKADAGGAIAGAIDGAITGALVPPGGGAVVGGLIGALAGAIGESVAALCG